MKNIALIIGLATILVGCCGPSTKAVKEICTGTTRPYKIQGKSYYPQDHYDYDEEGLASWYGPGFHKQSTSCGSIYDMHAYTAAHKTLPIPSVVEVTNLENGKNIRLVVNDRGPFVDNRIIDLSKKAAQELGTFNKGIARVRVKTLPDESKALANHLKQYGRYGIDPSGRKWDEIYFQEIAYQYPSPYNRKFQPRVSNTVMRSDSNHRPTLKNAVMKASRPQPKLERLTFSQDEEIIFEELISTPPHSIKTNSVKKKAPSPRPGGHFIQIGSFVQKHNADRLKKRLEKYGNTSIIRDRKSGNMYSIKLGPYPNHQTAKQKLNLVTNAGHHGARLVIN